MTLNLDKYKSVLVHAWKDVLDERNPINWALFGYDGQTYDLNLVGKGDGGLEELVEEFNSGKIQYALSKVKIKEKNLEKIVLINWQGEGAPLIRKGVSANHVDIIRGFFKGVHISIHARTDEDVEPDVILQIVGKAIAGEGIKIAPQSGDSSTSTNNVVGSNYKRVNPQEEINAKAKDDFWRKDQAEEERRRKEESSARHRKFSQDEVKLLRRESQDYFDKEEEEKAMSKMSSPQPPTQMMNGAVGGASTMNGDAISKSNIPPTSPIPPQSYSGGASTTNTAERTAALQASMPMKKNNSELVRSRIKSFDGGSSGPVFPSSNKSSMNTPPKMNGSNSLSKSLNVSSSDGGVRSPSPNNKSAPVNGSSPSDSLSVLKRKQLFESGGSPSSINGSSSTIIRRNPADEIRLAQEEEAKKLEEQKKKKKEEELKKKKVIEDEQFDRNKVVTSPTAHFQPAAVSVSPPPPVQQPAFFANPGVASGKSPSPTPIIQKQPTPTPPIQQKVREDEEIIREDNTVRSAHVNGGGPPKGSNGNSPSPAPPTSGDEEGDSSMSSMITINITPEMGVCARALYDYQAADDTEITIDPGDVIRNIEKIDEGWWEGLGPNDQYGLFPSNYVELIN